MTIPKPPLLKVESRTIDSDTLLNRAPPTPYSIYPYLGMFHFLDVIQGPGAFYSKPTAIVDGKIVHLEDPENVTTIDPPISPRTVGL